MSHFVVGVMTYDCKEGDFEGAEQVVERMLEPYSEHIEVEPYMKKCYCVGLIAQQESFVAASVVVGKSINDYRIEYFNMEEDKRPEWKVFIKDFLNAESQSVDKHPMKNKPNPDCANCNGTGEYETTYNPNSKWDWYQIGGRWTGLFSDYDPTKDERNYSECNFCNGTGDREGWVYYENGERKFKDDWAEECNGCNSCHGTGKSLNYGFVPFPGDVTKVKNVLNNWSEDKVPFAIMTPNGQWIERGEMMMFGMVDNEKEKNVWIRQCKAIMEEYDEATIIVVDCHI